MAQEARGDGSAAVHADPGDLSRLLQELARAPEEDLAGSWQRTLEPGEKVGRYQIRREVGRGGFGVVYEAFDPELGRTVALKALRPGRSRHHLPEAWLRKEAEAVARLNHPAIVTLHDVGTCASGPYLVMELLEGEPLSDRLEKGPLPVDEALRIADELAQGLAHAHAHGVLHRDLKPANAFLCADGRAKILDFGLAHLLGTEGGSSGGTPAYMAPEQATGAGVDERADVYALGTMLFQLLAGRLPYDPGGPRGVPEGGRAPEIHRAPAALGRLLDRMLARDLAGRMANAAEAHAALSALRRSREPRRLAWAAWTLAAVAGVAALVFAVKPPKLPPGRLRTAVADLENTTADRSLDGVGELLRASIEQSRRVALVPREALVGALRKASEPPPSTLGEPQALAAARALGVQLLLVPTIHSAGNLIELGLSAVDLAKNETLFGLREQVAAAASVYPAIDRLALRARKALLEDTGEAPRQPLTAEAMAPSSPEALRLYAEGMRLRSEYRYPKARKAFQDAVALDPDFALARLELLAGFGAVYFAPDTVEKEEALRHAEALRRNLYRLPAADRAWADHVLLVVEGGFGSLTDLLASLDRCIEARPEDPRPHLAAANRLVLWGGDASRGRPYVDRAAALSPPEGLGDVVDLLVVSGRLDEALAVARRWKAQVPGGLPAANLAIVHFARGEDQDALAVLREAGLSGDALPELYVETGSPDAVDEAFARAKVPPDPQWLATRGRMREAAARLEEDWAARLAAKAPPPGRYFLARALMAMTRGDGTAARAELERAFALRGSLADDAWVLAESGHLDLAERITAGRLLADEYGVRMYRALRAWRSGDREGALAALRSLAGCSRWFHEGEILADMGRVREAVAAFHTYRRLSPACASSMTDSDFRSRDLPRSLLLEAAARERLGDLDGARTVNGRLLALWAGADEGLPLLRESRALQARLDAARAPTR